MSPGSAGAIALRRIGAEVTVVEAYEDPAGPVDSFVSLAANGLRCLDLLDCLEPVSRAGFPVPRQRMWSGNGKLLGDVARGRLADDPRASVTVRRADLVAALRTEALRSEARIVTGRRVTELPVDADLVVGRTVSGQVPARSSIRRRRNRVMRASTRCRARRPGWRLPGGSFNMTFARHGAFLHVTAPDGQVWWSAQVSAAEEPDPRAVGLAELRAVFATESQASAILAAADGPLTRTVHQVLPPLATTHQDRTVLIGDAAHPVGAGQGASMALEDAVVLGQQLGLAQQHDGPSFVNDSVTAFDRLRRARIGKMVKMAASNRDAKTAGRFAAGMRDLVLPIVFPRVYPKATSWLYTYDPGPILAGPEVGHRADAVG